MADLAFVTVPAPITTGTSIKTLVQLLAPTNQRVVVNEASVSFNGVSNTSTPILCAVVRQTSAGTLTNSTTLVLCDNDMQETIQTVGKDTATAEPTDSGAVLANEFVHPQTGFLWQAPFGGEWKIAGASRLGLRVTAGTSVSAAVRLKCVE